MCAEASCRDLETCRTCPVQTTLHAVPTLSMAQTKQGLGAEKIAYCSYVLVMFGTANI
jgi:hypothetical protein